MPRQGDRTALAASLALLAVGFIVLIGISDRACLPAVPVGFGVVLVALFSSKTARDTGDEEA